MNIDANEEKNSLNEENGIEDKIASERRSFIQVSELKVDSVNQAEKHGSTSGLQAPSILQVQKQQQNQRTLFCWERFLHVRTIRVLLVEDDDSTRHVLTALLRNCNYEVLDAANGLQAWKILEDLTNHIDIVLTEVVMPSLSGIGLLSKITSHTARNNIPVIMMSSHDSMGLVFKCLSKGAVDFLVKPIRKNELKNLWQHVWRRCHSSSGSGSVSGTHPQKSVKSKCSEGSGNNASDGGENDASNGLNVGDGSDDGSGAQSSWTKQALEVDSSQALSPVDQVAERADSTCAQVIRSNAEQSDYRKVQVSVVGEVHGQKHPDTVGEGNYLDTIANKCVELKSEDHVEGQANPSGRESECTREVVAYKLDLNNNASDDCNEPNLELSLKRIRGVQDTGRSVLDDSYVLRRSEQSAFSRYNTSINISRAPNGVNISNSVLDNSMDVPKRESVGDMQVYSTDHIVHQSSNVDMGSTANKLPKDKSEATSTTNEVHPSAFRSIKKDFRYSKNQDIPLPSGMQSTDLCQINQNYHHHHHNFHIENQPSSNYDESSLKKLAVDAPHCGSTNVFGGSASGSNHGSNGQNVSSTVINVGNNAESGAGKSGSGDASGSGSGNKADASGSGSGNGDKFAQRAAALIKFRLKRKERCFKKKVRYQNRKKLAEQRPRVRGQFVKQTGTESSGKTGDE
ncbi:hypothetical protein ACP275_10G042600 [Erythranthe tilingii]